MIYQPTPGKGEKGFTLVELMVVIGMLVILGLLTTSFDTASWMAQSRLKGAARDLYANMQKARMNALKENTTWRIVFDTTAGSEQYCMCSSTNAGADGIWCTADDLPAGPNGLSCTTLASYQSGIAYGGGSAAQDINGNGAPFSSITFTGNTVAFNPTGLSNAGYCYLTNSQNGAFAVGASISGVIRMNTWHRTAWQ